MKTKLSGVQLVVHKQRDTSPSGPSRATERGSTWKKDPVFDTLREYTPPQLRSVGMQLLLGFAFVLTLVTTANAKPVMKMSAQEASRTASVIQCDGESVVGWQAPNPSHNWPGKAEMSDDTKMDRMLTIAVAAIVEKDAAALAHLVGKAKLKVYGKPVPRQRMRQRLRKILRNPKKSFGATRKDLRSGNVCWEVGPMVGGYWSIQTGNLDLIFERNDDGEGPVLLRSIRIPSDNEC